MYFPPGKLRITFETDKKEAVIENKIHHLYFKV